MSPRGLRFYTPADYVRRVLWALVQPLWRWSPRLCWGWRRMVLRVFGAKVGQGVRVYPAARIHQPWHLVIGPRCTIAWNCVLYCLAPVTIGADAVLSQGSQLCAGDHAIRDPEFPILKRPIVVGDGVWVAAEAFIGPGVSIGDRAVVGACAVVMRSVLAGTVVVGNPARVVGLR